MMFCPQTTSEVERYSIHHFFHDKEGTRLANTR